MAVKKVLVFDGMETAGAAFAYANIPDDVLSKYGEDAIAMLDTSEIRWAIEECALYVEDEEFDGPPGMSDITYEVYTDDEEEFKSELRKALIRLLDHS